MIIWLFYSVVVAAMVTGAKQNTDASWWMMN